MTVPESLRQPVTTTNVISTASPTKVHQFVRQNPVTSASFQATQEENGRGDHNGRVSIQPTGFEGGLLVGLYDPHLGPQCAEYLQQHLVPILDESLSTQLDHSDDDHSQNSNPNSHKIDPTQVIDTLKSTFRELDELLLATAITVALAQPDSTEFSSADEIKKTQELIAQVVTGSTALVGFLAPHRATTPVSGDDSAVQKHDFYLAQLGDSVAILAGYDEQGQWTVTRLNPPETYEHSVRYLGSEEYRKVVSEANQRALTAEQFLTQHSGAPQDDKNETVPTSECFLTKHGKFLGLPVTRAFGDLDWKMEKDARSSVATWVEKSLRAKIDQILGGGSHEGGEINGNDHHANTGVDNLSDPPYVTADPKIFRFILETRKSPSGTYTGTGASDQMLILLNHGLLYTARTSANSVEAREGNPYEQPLISDFELSRLVANTLEKGEENCALAVAKALDQTRKDLGILDREGEEGREGSVVVVVL
ncbi:hypothetical protein BGZ80_002281 [Entomortierella chlamydospora]|uniref:PPM-type phosphatase domain-containing protein n=1 Tax=Entomortierella chlamydospora TaxID=101097 RepID=A0A9P6SX79_9FUNG|nr:hypothetical protein BGZ79_001882 [Entomortierella chlamydospora]KAG0009541.1 hypothetical protein BGZ80_002281 [Entomortierella chlamydospora]